MNKIKMLMVLGSVLVSQMAYAGGNVSKMEEDNLEIGATTKYMASTLSQNDNTRYISGVSYAFKFMLNRAKQDQNFIKKSDDDLNQIINFIAQKDMELADYKIY